MKFAYITYCFLGNLFISGCITLAHSIRESGSLNDIIVLVTDDINESGRKILGSYCNHVIEIELRKFRALELSYDKIILISPDMVILKNIDYLFELDAPAGIVSNESVDRNLLVLKNDSFKELINNVLKNTKLIYDDHWNSFEFPKDKIIHFVKAKPFIITSKLKVSVTQNEKFIIWHYFYSQILKRNRKFLHLQELSEVNEIHRFFHSMIKSLSSTKINEITRVFDIESYQINEAHLDYYYLDKDHDYYLVEQEPMWDDIKEYDYFEPIKRLTEYFGNKSYYFSLFDNYSEAFEHKADRLDSQFGQQYDFTIEDIDIIALQYIKCRKNMLCSIVDETQAEQFISQLNGTTHYVKTISLNKNILCDIMYDELTHDYRNDIIEAPKNPVSIIFYELNFKKPSNDYFYQTLHVAQSILVNPITRTFKFNSFKFNSLKKWCYDNLSLLELERLILFKYDNDIEGIFVSLNELTQSEQELSELIGTNLFNSKTKFPFITIGFNGTKYWNNHLESLLKEIIDKFGISELELISDPEYYQYMNGLKVIKN